MNISPKNKKIIYISIAVVAGVYIINLWLKSQKKPLPAKLQVDELNETLVLAKGSTGAEVAELQKRLIQDYKQNIGNSGVNNDGVDGVFGSLTEKALLAVKGVKQISLKDI